MYAQSLAASKALPIVSLVMGMFVLETPGNVLAAASRSVFLLEMERASIAAAIVGIGIPRSRAVCAAQRPVPFCSAESSTRSTSGLSVMESCFASTAAEISIR